MNVIWPREPRRLLWGGLMLALAPGLLGCSAGQASAGTPTGTQGTPATAAAAAATPTIAATPAAPKAGNADVVSVRAVEAADGTWIFYVTVSHPDTGWEDYADGWDVVTPDGQVLKPDPGAEFTRTLLHPHVEEQPFTRSQAGIVVPVGVSQVLVRAHDLVDGFGGQEVVVDLEAGSGDKFEVERRE